VCDNSVFFYVSLFSSNEPVGDRRTDRETEGQDA